MVCVCRTCGRLSNWAQEKGTRLADRPCRCGGRLKRTTPVKRPDGAPVQCMACGHTIYRGQLAAWLGLTGAICGACHPAYYQAAAFPLTTQVPEVYLATSRFTVVRGIPAAPAEQQTARAVLRPSDVTRAV
jgi:hypothetical protein